MGCVEVRCGVGEAFGNMVAKRGFGRGGGRNIIKDISFFFPNATRKESEAKEKTKTKKKGKKKVVWKGSEGAPSRPGSLH